MVESHQMIPLSMHTDFTFRNILWNIHLLPLLVQVTGLQLSPPRAHGLTLVLPLSNRSLWPLPTGPCLLPRAVLRRNFPKKANLAHFPTVSVMLLCVCFVWRQLSVFKHCESEGLVQHVTPPSRPPLWAASPIPFPLLLRHLRVWPLTEEYKLTHF